MVTIVQCLNILFVWGALLLKHFFLFVLSVTKMECGDNFNLMKSFSHKSQNYTNSLITLFFIHHFYNFLNCYLSYLLKFKTITTFLMVKTLYHSLTKRKFEKNPVVTLLSC